MKKYSKKGLERRKEERQGFAEFFQKHVLNIKNQRECCKECGNKLRGDVSEVAHILPKNLYKSIATNDDNVIYLCSWKDTNNCHSIFDGTDEQLHSMVVFKAVQENVEKLLQKVTEKINYKIFDRWQI